MRTPSSPLVPTMSSRGSATAEGVYRSNLRDPQPWFVSLRSKVTSDLCWSLSLHFHIPSEYKLISSTSTKRPHSPPGHSHAFFTKQLEADLCFPIHPFLLEVSNYSDVLLNQLSPNSFWFKLGFYIVLTYLEIAPFSFLFHYFFPIKIGRAGDLLLQRSIRISIFDRCSIVSQRLEGTLFLCTSIFPLCFFIPLSPRSISLTF